jgi:hypothetical protein
VCGDKYHRKDLVLTQVEFLDMKGENYCNQSSYESTYWTVDDASDVTSTTVGTYGNRCDNVRLSLDDDNNLTYINSPKVWEGNGTMRMITDNTVNMISSADATFSCVFGPHEQNTSPSSTVVIGICNEAGDSKQVLSTWTDVSTITKVWFNEEVATLNSYSGVTGTTGSFFWYIQVTNAGKWWIDEIQLESNVNSLPTSSEGMPENFVRTTGSSIKSSAHPEQSMVTSRKVCPDCRELVLSKSEQYGRSDESPVDEPVDTWAQEF